MFSQVSCIVSWSSLSDVPSKPADKRSHFKVLKSKVSRRKREVQLVCLESLLPLTAPHPIRWHTGCARQKTSNILRSFKSCTLTSIKAEESTAQAARGGSRLTESAMEKPRGFYKAPRIQDGDPFISIKLLTQRMNPKKVLLTSAFWDNRASAVQSCDVTLIWQNLGGIF